MQAFKGRLGGLAIGAVCGLGPLLMWIVRLELSTNCLVVNKLFEI